LVPVVDLLDNGSTGAAQTAGNGGAVNNADYAGRGTVSVSGSTFLGNTANGGGGAVDSADNGGKGTLSVSASTFSGDQSDSSSVRAPSARLLKASAFPAARPVTGSRVTRQGSANVIDRWLAPS